MKIWILECRYLANPGLLMAMLPSLAMAAEAEADREARAKVRAAEGEQKASKALREAAEVIIDSPAALQVSDDDDDDTKVDDNMWDTS